MNNNQRIRNRQSKKLKKLELKKINLKKSPQIAFLVCFKITKELNHWQEQGQIRYRNNLSNFRRYLKSKLKKLFRLSRNN